MDKNYTERFMEKYLPFAQHYRERDGEMYYLYISTPYIDWDALRELGSSTQFSGIRLGKWNDDTVPGMEFQANTRIEWTTI